MLVPEEKVTTADLHVEQHLKFLDDTIRMKNRKPRTSKTPTTAISISTFLTLTHNSRRSNLKEAEKRLWGDPTENCCDADILYDFRHIGLVIQLAPED